MGRCRTIDRDKVLDAVEAIVDREGPVGLTIDAVAKAAGITKGGLQYCFGSKDQMIDALFERWAEEYDKQFNELVERTKDPVKFIRSYIAAARKCDRTQITRGAVMLATLMRSTKRMEQNRQWYRDKLAMFDLSTEAGRRMHLFYIAVEGVFTLRCLGFMELSNAEWQVMLDCIESLLPPNDA
jgi:AcrR family transcriptional regulator